MNLGSHTTAQIAKLLPELEARYRKAEEEVSAARRSLISAQASAQEAKNALVEGLGRLLRGYPIDLVRLAIETPVRADNPDNGHATNAPDAAT